MNCLTFDPLSPSEFAAALAQAVRTDPLPLSLGERRALTWAAATDRLIK
jgi:hypothetical protein